MVEFLRENVFYKFGYPRELVTNQGSQFTSHMIENMLSQHKIKHRKSTPYHPQANGILEVTNKALEGILTKVISSNRKDQADRLVEATWAYNTTQKTTTGFTPYELVYGKKALLSIEFEYNTLMMAAQLVGSQSCTERNIVPFEWLGRIQNVGPPTYRDILASEEDLELQTY